MLSLRNKLPLIMFVCAPNSIREEQFARRNLHSDLADEVVFSSLKRKKILRQTNLC